MLDFSFMWLSANNFMKPCQKQKVSLHDQIKWKRWLNSGKKQVLLGLDEKKTQNYFKSLKHSLTGYFSLARFFPMIDVFNEGLTAESSPTCSHSHPRLKTLFSRRRWVQLYVGLTTCETLQSFV